MALAPFFDRIYGALGAHLSVSRDSLTAVLESVTVGVNCGSDCTENDVWAAELVTNLIARLYPRISISGAASVKLRKLALAINPEIEFVDGAPGETSVCVGRARVPGALYPFSAGWVAGIHHGGPPHSGPANPYAAGAAAAFACAELFRRIFLKTGRERDFCLSLLDFGTSKGKSSELRTTDVGEVLFVGTGAVGNSALWALRRDPALKGKLILVDGEDLSVLNLQRYVLGEFACIGRSKVEIAKKALARCGLNVETHKTSLGDFAELSKGINVPKICISVDNVEARRAAQALLPKLIVNGWTGDRALGTSWHVFVRKAACLACLYQPHAQGPSATEQAASALGLSVERATLLWVTRQPLTEEDVKIIALHLGVDDATLEPWRTKSLGELYTDIVCGAVPLDVLGVGKVEAVPLAHQSAMAGVLLAAELVKRSNRELSGMAQREPLVSWDDILRPPPTIWTKPRPREKGCICQDPDYQAIYRSKWSKR